MTLISCEGIDGSGKTTVIDELRRRDTSFIFTKEPTGSVYGEILRSKSRYDDAPEILDFFLLMCDRVTHMQTVIEPALDSGASVITDRYTDSTRAYQSIALSQDDAPFSTEWSAELFINKVMHSWVREPDYVIYFDVPVDTAVERLSNEHRYEQRQFLEKVKKNYDVLYEKRDNIMKVDATQEPSRVADDVISIIGSV